MVKGELAPGRSSRACVVLINPGVSLSDIKNALDAALSHLERTKPGVVHGIAVPQKGKQLLFFTPRLELEAAETLEISGKADLEKPHDGLAHLLVYAPPTLRHWQDAYDDIEAFKRTLQHEGLTRGFLSTALGRLPVIESKSGIRAEIEHRRTWVPDNYFSLEGFDDDDEEDEEDDE